MICTCGRGCIRVQVPWLKSGAWLCTKCGYLARLDYNTGTKEVLWRPRRYGSKVASF